MQKLPDEMVWHEVKAAIKRGVPHTMVTFHGTTLQLYKFMKGLGEYLTKKRLHGENP